MNCPLDPFFVLPDSCKCVDSQTLKLQENPENVPNGEIPRHIQLYAERYLCDKIVPGNRVTVTGIYSIKRVGAAGKVNFNLIKLLKLLDLLKLDHFWIEFIERKAEYRYKTALFESSGYTDRLGWQQYHQLAVADF